MLLPYLLAVASLNQQDQFATTFEPTNIVRLQLTPTLDGQVGKEEWDPLTEQVNFQWEPNKLHVGGTVPAGKAIVLSLDLKGDGWLVGEDNYEFRITADDKGPITSVRQLDATRREGPRWVARPDLELGASAAATLGESNVLEGTFRDVGLKLFPQKPKDIWMRADVVDAAAESNPAQPRVCARLWFDTQRAVAMPTAMDWGIEARSRSVIPGEAVRLRYTFRGEKSIGAKSIELRTQGEAEEHANRMSLLFPSFDNKGRAFVDYTTSIGGNAGTGYRIAQARLSFDNGPDALVQASYRIAPLMDFYFEKPIVDELPENNTIRLAYVLQLYTRQNADGIVRVQVPEGWEVTKGDGMKFAMLGNQSAERRSIELKVPADARGTYPIRLTGQVKDQSATQTLYVTIR